MGKSEVGKGEFRRAAGDALKEFVGEFVFLFPNSRNEQLKSKTRKDR